jgi:hypothetical protein
MIEMTPHRGWSKAQRAPERRCGHWSVFQDQPRNTGTGALLGARVSTKLTHSRLAHVFHNIIVP